MRECMRDVVVFAGLVMAELGEVGIATISKAAMSKGMSPFVYVVYYNVLGILFLLPPFLFYRPKQRPLTFHLLTALFFLGLIGAGFGQIIWFIGIRYGSPTLSIAMSNLTPALIFLLAIILRMENLDLRIRSSQAKSIGAIISISGAFVVTLYKGVPIIIIPSHSPDHNHQELLQSSTQSNWVLGGLLLSFSCFLGAIWYIGQATVMKKYPSEITVVFFCCFFGTIQCTIICSIVERDLNTWKVKPDIELTAIVITAVFASIIRILHMWGIHLKGPVYVAMFKPLGIVFAVIMGTSFLGDTLYTGSVVGAIIIVLGFYAVMWGKAKEKVDDVSSVGSLEPSTQSHKEPLLPSNEMGI